jgi:hypothetical protein
VAKSRVRAKPKKQKKASCQTPSTHTGGAPCLRETSEPQALLPDFAGLEWVARNLQPKQAALRCASHRGDGPVQFLGPRLQFSSGLWLIRQHNRTWKIRRRPSLLGQAHIGPCKSCPSDATH